MNHDDFDQQIREALQVVPSPQQVARLEHFWQQQRRADRHRRMRRGLALAASVLVAATVSARFWWQKPAGQPGQADLAAPVASKTIASGAVAPKTVEPIRSELPQIAVDDSPSHEDRSSSAGRPPTAYERFVFAVHTSQPATAKPPMQVADLDRVLEQLKQNPATYVEQLAEVVRQSSDRHVRAALFRRLLTADDEPALRGYLSLLYDGAIRAETLAAAEALPQLPLASLLALLDDEEKKVRLAAAMVLGHVNGPEITQSLISRVKREPSGPTEVWIALLACRGPLAEKFLSYADYQPLLLGHVNNARVQMTRMIP